MTPAQLRALELHKPVQRRNFEEPSPEGQRANRIRRSIVDGSWADKVAAFRSLFTLDQHNRSEPGFLVEERMDLHSDMSISEGNELYYAIDDNDFKEFVDGILDRIYVDLGWLLECGLTPDQINDCFAEIHASNLTKTDDKGLPMLNGVTCELDPTQPVGKVLKGASYLKADVGAVLEQSALTTPADCATSDSLAGEQSNG